MTLKEAWMSYLKGENIEEAIKKSEKIKKLNDLLKKYWREEVMEQKVKSLKTKVENDYKSQSYTIYILFIKWLALQNIQILTL